MTRYSIDSDARTKAALSIAALSIICTILTNQHFFPWFESVASHIGAEEIYQTLSTVGITGSIATFAWYGLFWSLFDNLLWKLGIFRHFHGIPNLNGEWSGRATSSFKNENGDPYTYDMVLDITQTFTKIQCAARFANSESKNGCIGISACNPEKKRCCLEFSYDNDAGENAVKVDSWQVSHLGFNKIQCEGHTMNGQYFTNRDPQTKGTFHLEKTANKKTA